jgi:hypothetical protein
MFLNTVIMPASSRLFIVPLYQNMPVQYDMGDLHCTVTAITNL